MDSGWVHNSARERLSSFVNQMLVQHPASMTSEYMSGFIPFEGVLTEWVNQMTQSAKQGLHTEHVERFASLWANLIKRFGRQSNSASSLARSNSNKYNAPSSGDVESAMPACLEFAKPNQTFASPVRLPVTAYFAFQMLSSIVDCLNERREVLESDRRRLKRKKSSYSSDYIDESLIPSQVTRKIACIPRLLYVVLLLQDKVQQKYILSTTIMKAVLASRYSVDKWLTEMLQSGEKQIADGGIEYLQMVSDAVCNRKDFSGPQNCQYHNRCSGRDLDYNEEVAEAISSLEGFVPSLLSLSKRHVEEAAITQVVQRVLDKIMSRRFCDTDNWIPIGSQ